MKSYPIIILLIVISTILSCKQEAPVKIVESRNDFRDLVFDAFEHRIVTCNPEEGYILFENMDSIVIKKGITKTPNGYRLNKGKISDLEFTDCTLRLRLERIQNGACMLYYEYRRDVDDPLSDKTIRDLDKGKVVLTCDK